MKDEPCVFHVSSAPRVSRWTLCQPRHKVYGFLKIVKPKRAFRGLNFAANTSRLGSLPYINSLNTIFGVEMRTLPRTFHLKDNDMVWLGLSHIAIRKRFKKIEITAGIQTADIYLSKRERARARRPNDGRRQ